MRRPRRGSPGFDDGLLHIYDIVAANYGCLPSEIAKLSWSDLALNVAALKARSKRLDKLMAKTRRKKTPIFPTINLRDMILTL